MNAQDIKDMEEHLGFIPFNKTNKSSLHSNNELLQSLENDKKSHYFKQDDNDNQRELFKFRKPNNFIEKEVLFTYFKDVYYFLYKNENCKYLFTEKQQENNEIKYIIEHNENNEKVLLETDFTIRLPKLEKIIHGHKEVLQKECKLFERMIEINNNEMTIEEDEELFIKMIDFIYIGKIGKTKKELNNETIKQEYELFNNEKLIDIFGLIDFLIIADQYQCISLLKQIGNVIHEYNAMIIGKKCCELSEDTQNIILPYCAKVIASNLECIVATSIFKLFNHNKEYNDYNEIYENQLKINKEEAEEMQLKLEKLKNYLEKTKIAERYESGGSNFVKDLIFDIERGYELDFIYQFLNIPDNLFKLIMSHNLQYRNDNDKLEMAFAWMAVDNDNIERRRKYKEIIMECFDLNKIDYNYLYVYIYLVCKIHEEEYSLLQNLLIKILFTKSNIPMLKDTNEKEYQIFLLGLDFAGKSTLFYRLQNFTDFHYYIPTASENVETFTMKYKEKQLKVSYLIILLM
ncbi:hypothetical protein ABK040_011871 [Willaertia magna]